MVLGVGRFKDAFGKRLEQLSALLERILRLKLGRQLLYPLPDDLVPVERTVDALAVHRHREVVVQAVVVLRHLGERIPRRAGVVVGEREEFDALEDDVKLLLRLAMHVRSAPDLERGRPIDARIRAAVARGLSGRRSRCLAAGFRILRIRCHATAHRRSHGGPHHEFASVHCLFLHIVLCQRIIS